MRGNFPVSPKSPLSCGKLGQTACVKGHCTARSHSLRGNSSKNRDLPFPMYCAKAFVSTISFIMTAVQRKCGHDTSFTTRRLR